MIVLVIFQDAKGHPLNFLLKKKFKHCFVCIKSGDYWIEVDILKGVPHIKLMTNSEFDMETFYRDQGKIVVKTRQRAICPPKLTYLFYGTFMIANCVGLVKMILGIHNWSWTPYSLYKELIK